MRRASEPEVPLIPAQFLHPKNKPQFQRSPTLPCSWSPSLTHAPLSSDPAIRAFSTEREAFERPVTRAVSARGKASTHDVRFVEPSLDPNLSSKTSSVRPQLPVRARGCSFASDIVHAGFPSANVSVPTATYSIRPRISVTPASSDLSSLYVPRSRHVLAPNQSSSYRIKRPQLTHQTSPADSNITVSSILSTESATHSILEAQRVKRRWELARSREASVYGMGGWTVVSEDDTPITSMKKSRRRGREGSRACTGT
jgi:hypothetical protein